LNDQFMELGYHIYVLTTQSPDVEATKPILYATVFVLLVLTFANAVVMKDSFDVGIDLLADVARDREGPAASPCRVSPAPSASASLPRAVQ